MGYQTLLSAGHLGASQAVGQGPSGEPQAPNDAKVATRVASRFDHLVPGSGDETCQKDPGGYTGLYHLHVY